MIEEERFTDIVTRTFSFLVTEFGFELSKKTTNGNMFFDIEYTDKRKAISISLETIENYIRVILFKLENGKRSDYDDMTKTFHLNQLNDKLLKNLDSAEFEQNNKHFDSFEPMDEIEKMILKSAKDLRLCLKHIDN